MANLLKPCPFKNPKSIVTHTVALLANQVACSNPHDFLLTDFSGKTHCVNLEGIK